MNHVRLLAVSLQQRANTLRRWSVRTCSHAKCRQPLPRLILLQQIGSLDGRPGNTWATHQPAPAAKHEGAERRKLASRRQSVPRTTTSDKRRGVPVMKGSAVRIRASASSIDTGSGDVVAASSPSSAYIERSACDFDCGAGGDARARIKLLEDVRVRVERDRRRQREGADRLRHCAPVHPFTGCDRGKLRAGQALPRYRPNGLAGPATPSRSHAQTGRRRRPDPRPPQPPWDRSFPAR
jgi:hypothetical protein